MTRLRGVAARLRPTSRKGAVGLALAGVVLVVGLASLVVVVPWVYDEYGYHPAENARSWAALTPQYADSAVCQQCHATEYTPWQAGQHAVVACESCHGPLAAHAATAPRGGAARVAGDRGAAAGTLRPVPRAGARQAAGVPRRGI